MTSGQQRRPGNYWTHLVAVSRPKKDRPVLSMGFTTVVEVWTGLEDIWAFCSRYFASSDLSKVVFGPKKGWRCFPGIHRERDEAGKATRTGFGAWPHLGGARGVVLLSTLIQWCNLWDNPHFTTSVSSEVGAARIGKTLRGGLLCGCGAGLRLKQVWQELPQWWCIWWLWGRHHHHHHH